MSPPELDSRYESRANLVGPKGIGLSVGQTGNHGIAYLWAAGLGTIPLSFSELHELKNLVDRTISFVQAGQP